MVVQEEWRLTGILVGGGSALYLVSCVAQLVFSPPPGQEAAWILTLALNLLGYATILLPGYLALRYTFLCLPASIPYVATVHVL